jgi:hypothetical protein
MRVVPIAHSPGRLEQYHVIRVNTTAGRDSVCGRCGDKGLSGRRRVGGVFRTLLRCGGCDSQRIPGLTLSLLSVVLSLSCSRSRVSFS